MGGGVSILRRLVVAISLVCLRCAAPQCCSRGSDMPVLVSAGVVAHGHCQRLPVEEFVGLQVRCSRSIASPVIQAAYAIWQSQECVPLRVRGEHRHAQSQFARCAVDHSRLPQR